MRKTRLNDRIGEGGREGGEGRGSRHELNMEYEYKKEKEEKN